MHAEIQVDFASTAVDPSQRRLQSMVKKSETYEAQQVLEGGVWLEVRGVWLKVRGVWLEARGEVG